MAGIFIDPASRWHRVAGFSLRDAGKRKQDEGERRDGAEAHRGLIFQTVASEKKTRLVGELQATIRLESCNAAGNSKAGADWVPQPALGNV